MLSGLGGYEEERFIGCPGYLVCQDCRAMEGVKIGRVEEIMGCPGYLGCQGCCAMKVMGRDHGLWRLFKNIIT